jgi:hypothetical protein
LVKQGTLYHAEFVQQRWGGFKEGLGIGKILQTFRAAASRISSGTELFVEQIGAPDDPEAYLC